MNIEMEQRVGELGDLEFELVEGYGFAGIGVDDSEAAWEGR